jgi:hypothetical protein
MDSNIPSGLFKYLWKSDLKLFWQCGAEYLPLISS